MLVPAVASLMFVLFSRCFPAGGRIPYPMASIKSPKRSPTASTFESYSGLKNSFTLKLVFLAICACALVAAVHSPEDDGVDVIGTALRGDHGPRRANIMVSTGRKQS